MSHMANYWAEKGWEITLLTFDGKPSFYELHPAVNHQALGLAGVSRGAVDAVRNNLKRLRVLRAAIRASSPEAVVSSMSETNVSVLLASIGLSVPVLVLEQIDPNQHRIGKVWNILRLLTYRHAGAVVALNQASLSYFPRSIRKRGRVIPNPAVVKEGVRNPSNQAGYTLMAMGRLDAQKGFDLLLEAFARIAPDHPDWSLEIWGEGGMREELESLMAKLGLIGRARLAGVTRNAFDQLRRADLFVLSSRYEGFPLVLCEAMGCGLPVVSFDCPSGPNEIIRDGLDGILVPRADVGALAETLHRLMADGRERERISKRAPEVLERFGIGRVMEKWEQAIRDCRPLRQAAGSKNELEPQGEVMEASNTTRCRP